MAKTHIVFGDPTKQDSSSAYGAPLGDEEIKGLKEELGLPVDKKFFVSQEVRDFFAERKKELRQKKN